MAQDLSLLFAVQVTVTLDTYFQGFERTLFITDADFGLAPRSCAVCNAGGSKS